eukprot:scaffold42937_cov70-Phaeocystis_antarctica.AAC.3
MASAVAMGDLNCLSCICVDKVSMGIVIKQSMAPALPPATSVRQPPFCLGADDSGAALCCVLPPASSGV